MKCIHNCPDIDITLLVNLVPHYLVVSTRGSGEVAAYPLPPITALKTYPSFRSELGLLSIVSYS